MTRPRVTFELITGLLGVEADGGLATITVSLGHEDATEATVDIFITPTVRPKDGESWETTLSLSPRDCDALADALRKLAADAREP